MQYGVPIPHPPSPILTGIDLVETGRIAAAVQRHGDRFLQRVWTAEELALCRGNVQRLAGRFALKEAVAKALGTGIGVVGWRDIALLNGPNGAPRLVLTGEAERLSADHRLTWSVSLSHTATHAVAMAVAAAS